MNATFVELNGQFATDGTQLAASDVRFAVTLFHAFGAASKDEEVHGLNSLGAAIRAATARTKAELPWLKLARFGEERTHKKSLRHDANVLAITGIEGDYDDEKVAFEDAIELARKADLNCIIYTSPSHTEDTPRWRVLCPISEELPPDRRNGLMGRLNGVFGGIFSGESWTLSQSYYFGSVRQNPSHRVEAIEGTPIDLLHDLDETWIGKADTGPARVDRGTGERRSGPIDEAAILHQLISGENYHQSAVRLLGKWARDGIAYMEARVRLITAMEQIPQAQRDARWRDRFDDIDRCLDDIYGKQAGARDRGERSSIDPGVGAPTADVAELTEHSVAEIFAARHADLIRFCHTDGYWYIWTGTHWARNETKVVFDRIRRVVASLNRRAERRVRAATGRANFTGSVERFAQADPALAITTTMMDTDPWLLATRGGTVDLRTGIVRRAEPEDLISRCTSVAPAETIDCPTWLRFLNDSLAGDRDAIAFLQRWLGYCLTGLVREHKLVFVIGPGGNGKSVMITTFFRLLGNYAVAAALDAFTAARGERHSTDLAMLAGARFIVVLETEEGRDWAESRVKAFTGGDPITAHYMRRDNFTFAPTGKITISGNHAPALQNVDEAARRRFLIVPFLAQPVQPDPLLLERLQAEWPGILRWAIEGCLEWQRIGLASPMAIQAATAEYFSDQDLIGQWLDERCQRHAGYGETSALLFESWKSFVTQRGDAVGSAKRFGAALDRRGFKRDKDCEAFRGRGYLGIRLWRSPREREAKTGKPKESAP